jgi:protein-S-isoprenylcysteine O-methyltransferase Ste14
MNGWNVSFGWRQVDAVTFAVSVVVGLCAAVVLVAVIANFAEARRGGAIERRTRSVVATGTMLLFFAALFACVRTGVGVVRLNSPLARAVVAIAGLVPVVTGCVVNVLGRIQLGANWANQVTVYRTQTLVTNGAFGVVRHPLYASLIWMALGASLAYRDRVAAALTLLVFLPAMHYRAGQEEALLERRFPEYRAYRERVGRFFPKLFQGGST